MRKAILISHAYILKGFSINCFYYPLFLDVLCFLLSYIFSVELKKLYYPSWSRALRDLTQIMGQQSKAVLQSSSGRILYVVALWIPAGSLFSGGTFMVIASCPRDLHLVSALSLSCSSLRLHFNYKALFLYHKESTCNKYEIDLLIQLLM